MRLAPLGNKTPIPEHNACDRPSSLGRANYQTVVISLGAVRSREVAAKIGRIALVGGILRVGYCFSKFRRINACFVRFQR
jgi:hypothetical protein